ncbi:MFS transporter [Amycolatopsis sp. CA-230715]|uniref:MFS transporter n=1 Tax=Amycolatopsis sp. CA-230715 TaxID=2745196 RepID=UPI001C02E80A|nr:MFS transporter [Amycolatopsis sp. CA-230715]QWF82549.1 Antiseptic resistance protein [Amycolatopsis sp. CA-230715]
MSAPKPPAPWAALTAVVLGVVIVALDGTIVAASNPRLGAELDASLGDLQWITNGYLLVMAPSMVLAGRIGDRFGRRPVFLVGVAGFGLASMVIGFSGSVELVLVARGAQGFFGGLVMTNSLALLRATFPAERLPAAVSVFGALAASSIAAGPIVGGVVVDRLGWRWAFFVNAPIAVACLVLGRRVLRAPRPDHPPAFDLGGAVLLTAALSSLAYGLVRAPAAGWDDLAVVGALAASVPLGVAFVLVERRARHPLVPLRLFADRTVSAGVALTVTTDFAMVGLPIFVSLFIQKVDGLSPIEASLRLIPLGVFAVLGSALGARLLPKVGRRPVLLGGALMSATGFLLLTGIGLGSPFARLAVPFALLGFGLSLVMNSAIQAVLGGVPEADAGAAAGVQQSANQVGGLLGTSVLGAVLAGAAGARFDASGGLAVALTSAAKNGFLDGVHAVMWVGAGVSALSFCLALLVAREKVFFDDQGNGAPEIARSRRQA